VRRLGVAVSALMWTFVVAIITGKVSVVRTWSVIVSWRVVVSADEVAKVANTNQFFNRVLECFAFLCGVVVVSVIAAICIHVGIRGSGRLTWWWYEVGL